MLAFQQIATAAYCKEIREWSVRRSDIKWVDLVGDQAECRIGAKERRDLLGARFLHPDLSGA